jgi:hypothetical protein
MTVVGLEPRVSSDEIPSGWFSAILYERDFEIRSVLYPSVTYYADGIIT